MLIDKKEIYKAGFPRSLRCMRKPVVVAEGIDKAGLPDVGFTDYRDLGCRAFRIRAAQTDACFESSLPDCKIAHPCLLYLCFILQSLCAGGKRFNDKYTDETILLFYKFHIGRMIY
jgi:predicted metal-binding transcription factor (methanogenesis marker protein 9)